MDLAACNWTCTSGDRGIHPIADITLSVLWTLELGLLGIIYDDSVALDVSQLMPRLANKTNVILFLADDIIRDEAIARSYLDLVSRQLEWRSPVSLVVTGDFNKTDGVFKSISRHNAWLGRQSGVGLYTKWLVVLRDDNSAALENNLNDLYNVGVIVPNSTTYEDSSKREVVIKTLIVKPEGKRFETIGASFGGNVTLWEPVFPNINRGFNCMHLIVGVYVWRPFTMRVFHNGSVTYEGFSVDMITELSRRLNFTFSMVEPADNQWGAPLGDGSWTGIVGMLQKHEIDVSVAALMITSEREEVMDATLPYYYDNFAVIYKRPDPEENLWLTYFHPFSEEVYIITAASIGGAAVIYILVAFLSPRSPTHNAIVHRKWFKVISDTEAQGSRLIFALIHQSLPYLPSYGSGRMLVAFWWIFAILLAATYKGNLMAFLLVAKSERPFTTLWDLGTQNVYRWGVTGSTVVEYLFKISNRSDFKKLGEGLERFKTMDPDTNSTDPLVHLRKVREGNYAYISDQVPMDFWVAVDCDLRILEERVIPLPFIVGLHNNSAYITAFNEQLLDIDQMGIYTQWKNHWWPLDNKCEVDSSTESRALTLLETQAAFYILCIGLSVGALVLISECIWTMALCGMLRKNFYDNWWGKKI